MSNSGGIATPGSTTLNGSDVGPFQGVAVELLRATGDSRRWVEFDAFAENSQGLGVAGVHSLKWNGVGLVNDRTPNAFKVITTLAVGAEATIWTPAAGKKFRLMGFMFFFSASVFFVLKDNTAGTTIWRGAGGTAAATPTTSPPGMGNGIVSVAANNVLTMTTSGAANLDGVVFGTEE